MVANYTNERKLLTLAQQMNKLTWQRSFILDGKENEFAQKYPMISNVAEKTWLEQTINTFNAKTVVTSDTLFNHRIAHKYTEASALMVHFAEISMSEAIDYMQGEDYIAAVRDLKDKKATQPHTTNIALQTMIASGQHLVMTKVADRQEEFITNCVERKLQPHLIYQAWPVLLKLEAERYSVI